MSSTRARVLLVQHLGPTSWCYPAVLWHRNFAIFKTSEIAKVFLGKSPQIFYPAISKTGSDFSVLSCGEGCRKCNS